jgi:hypothetical protein
MINLRHVLRACRLAAGLIHSQFGAQWVLEKDACAMPNIESAKLGIMVAPFTDIVLFLIMLFGFLRLRTHCRGTSTLGNSLWK